MPGAHSTPVNLSPVELAKRDARPSPSAASTLTTNPRRARRAVSVLEPSPTQASNNGGSQDNEQTVPQVMPCASPFGAAVVITATPVGSDAASDRKCSGATP